MPETFLQALKRELFKNWQKRIEYALLLAVPFYFLVDEAAKEGYLFRISDVFQTAYISHEQLILTSLIIGFFVKWYNDSVRPKAAH